jgi:hypothetical protein
MVLPVKLPWTHKFLIAAAIIFAGRVIIGSPPGQTFMAMRIKLDRQKIAQLQREIDELRGEQRGKVLAGNVPNDTP